MFNLYLESYLTWSSLGSWCSIRSRRTWSSSLVGRTSRTGSSSSYSVELSSFNPTSRGEYKYNLNKAIALKTIRNKFVILLNFYISCFPFFFLGCMHLYIMFFIFFLLELPSKHQLPASELLGHKCPGCMELLEYFPQMTTCNLDFAGPGQLQLSSSCSYLEFWGSPPK